MLKQLIQLKNTPHRRPNLTLAVRVASRNGPSGQLGPQSRAVHADDGTVQATGESVEQFSIQQCCIQLLLLLLADAVLLLATVWRHARYEWIRLGD